jgi:hypothetical protein
LPEREEFQFWTRDESGPKLNLRCPTIKKRRPDGLIRLGRSLGRRKTEPKIVVSGSCVGDRLPNWKMRRLFY